MSTSNSNKEVVLQYVEAFNRCDLETLKQLFTPDALVYGVLYQLPKCLLQINLRVSVSPRPRVSHL